EVRLRDPLALRGEAISLDGLRRIPRAKSTLELLVQRVPARAHVSDDAVGERRSALVVRVGALARPRAGLDALVDLGELRATQLGDRAVEPVGEVLLDLLLHRGD